MHISFTHHLNKFVTLKEKGNPHSHPTYSSILVGLFRTRGLVVERGCIERYQHSGSSSCCERHHSYYLPPCLFSDLLDGCNARAIGETGGEDTWKRRGKETISNLFDGRNAKAARGEERKTSVSNSPGKDGEEDMEDKEEKASRGHNKEARDPEPLERRERSRKDRRAPEDKDLAPGRGYRCGVRARIDELRPRRPFVVK